MLVYVLRIMLGLTYVLPELLPILSMKVLIHSSQIYSIYIGQGKWQFSIL